MSKLAIKGNDSGSATFTIEAPATSTDRTLTLPDEAGTVLTSGGTSLQEQVSTTQVAFQVTALNHDQSYSTGQALIQWPTVALDSHSYWDNTNHRYTPQIAGWYFFSSTLRFLVGSPPSYYKITIRKNGAEGDDSLVIQQQFTSAVVSNGTFPGPSGMIYLNGSTDYADMTFEANNSVTIHDSTVQESFFTGFLMRKA